MRCLLVLRFTALLYLAEAASFFFSLLAFFNFISLPSEIRAFCELVLGPLLSRRPPSWRPSSWRFLLGGFGLYLAASLLGPRSRVSVAGVPFSPRSQCTVTVFTLNL